MTRKKFFLGEICSTNVNAQNCLKHSKLSTFISSKCIFLSFSSDQRTEKEILDQIRKCADAVNTNVIEHTAYIRATAAKKDINLDKYKNEVREELESTSAKSSGDFFQNLLFVNLFHVQI